MATREQHNQEGYDACVETWGREPTEAERRAIDEINQRLDQFAHYPDMEFLRRHRKFLHHAEGVEYFARRYGELGRLVAERHILTDCGHIPKAADYYVPGKLDTFGGKRGR